MHEFFVAPFRVAMIHRDLLVRTVADELRQRYAGSLFGRLWLLLAPLLLMGIYSGVYLMIFRIQPASMNRLDYVLYMLSGLIPILGFSDALNAGTAALTANRGIMLNTVFPAELVPLRAVVASQVPAGVGLALTLVLGAVLGKAEWTWLAVPVIWMTLVLFTAGLAWITSLAALVVRDTQQIVGFVVMVLLIASPVAYTPDMAGGRLRWVILANPLSYFVIGLQETVLFGRLPPAGYVLATVGLGLGGCAVGYWIFSRAKKTFADYA